MNNTDYYRRIQMGHEQIYEHIRQNPYHHANFSTRYDYIVDRWVNRVNEVVVSNMKKEKEIRDREVHSIGSFFKKVYV